MHNAENLLNSSYDFYLNVLTGKTCFKTKDDNDENYQPLTDFNFNSIFRELKNAHIQIGQNELRSLLYSDFVKKVHPFAEFLKSVELKEDDQEDYIFKVAETVKTADDRYFQWIFKKWFVNLVACVVKNGVANENMIILVGKQGIGKTRWVESLLPEELSDYYYSGEIDPKNKDHKALFSEKILINLDEVVSLSKNKVEPFKALLSDKKVTFRRPHGIFNDDYNRVASVIGTSNHIDVLHDNTGNRRYLCIEVEGFENINKTYLKKAYRQAINLLNTGFQYFFTQHEIKSVNLVNQKFMVADEYLDLINSNFESCDPEDADATFMNSTEIVKYIKQKNVQSPLLNVTKVGRVMSDIGFKSKKINGLKKYALKLKVVINN